MKKKKDSENEIFEFLVSLHQIINIIRKREKTISKMTNSSGLEFKKRFNQDKFCVIFINVISFQRMGWVNIKLND